MIAASESREFRVEDEHAYNPSFRHESHANIQEQKDIS